MNQEKKSANSTETLKVLVVDDDFVSRQILYEIMLPYGHTDKVNDGDVALEAYTTALDAGAPYDLILLDIMMPTMDGKEVLERIRKIETQKNIPNEDRIKVIMVTGLQDSKNIMESFKHGCEGYLTKPLDKRKLMSLLKTLPFKKQLTF